MKVRVIDKPCLFAETVYLLYYYINGIAYTRDYERVNRKFGRYLLEKEDQGLQLAQELDRISAAVTQTLDPHQARLRFFFEKLPGTDEKTCCCLAHTMLVATPLNCTDIDSFAAELLRTFRYMSGIGFKINDMNTMGLVLEPLDPQEEPEPLQVQLERLPCSMEARWEILRVLTEFETYLRELTELLRPVAEQLAAAGFNVALNCSSEAGLPALREQAGRIAGEHGVRVEAIAASVADEAEANALVEQAHEAFGRLDAVVNNAGITRDGLMVRMKDDDFDRVIDVNLKGTFHICRAAGKIMMKQRYGRIVNMSSISGVGGNAGQANYAASKAGVIGLTKTIARELAARGVTANAVAPGFISTDMTDALSEKQREAIGEQIPMKRFGTVDDVAHLVGFLASEESGYITGQVICIDGGLAL